MDNQNPRVLIAGGDQDPNLLRLANTLEQRKTPHFFLKTGGEKPWLSWDLTCDQLLLNGKPIRPTAAFVRHDVFSQLANPRPAVSKRAFAWYTAVTGWLAAHPEVRFLNRASMHSGTNKPYALFLAQQVGLAIPPTLIVNHLGRAEAFLGDYPKIVKPINGGGYCQKLKDVVERTQTTEERIAASPAIVQHQLVQPEYRIYRIGEHFLGFAMVTPSLDYRVNQDCEVQPWEPRPKSLLNGFKRLTDKMGLNFAAGDFKSHPDTNELMFLEVNSGPMFAAFDIAGNGDLCRTIAEYLETAQE